MTLQNPADWMRLTTAQGYEQDLRTTNAVPLSGADKTAPLYSPFVIRPILPTCINGQGVMEVNETQRGARPTQRLRADSRDTTDYSAASGNEQGGYRSLISMGGGIPGLKDSSVQALRTANNPAQYSNRYAGAVRSALAGSRNTPDTRIIPSSTSQTTLISTILQLKELLSVPPLVLLINPQSLNRTYSKVSQFTERSRTGMVYQTWGETPPTLSLEMRVGSWVTGGTNRSNSRGVSRAARNESASFGQLMTVLNLFMSGGHVYDDSTGTRRISHVGNLALEYDGWVWVGHMDSCNYTEDETNQNGGVVLSMEFTTIAEFDYSSSNRTVDPLTNPNRAVQVRPLSGRRDPNGGGARATFTAPSIGTTGPRPPTPWEPFTRGGAALDPPRTNLGRRRV